MYEGQDNVAGLGELPTVTAATRAGPAAATTVPAPVAAETAPAAEAIPAAASQASTYAEYPSGPSGEGCVSKGSAGVVAGPPPEAAAANAAADAAPEADAAADLAAYRQLHHQRYAERLLREAAEAELIQRQREEQVHDSNYCCCRASRAAAAGIAVVEFCAALLPSFTGAAGDRSDRFATGA